MIVIGTPAPKPGQPPSGGKNGRLANRNLIPSAGADQTIKTWDLDTLNETASPPMDALRRFHRAAPADEGLIVAGLDNGDVVPWSLTGLPSSRKPPE